MSSTFSPIILTVAAIASRLPPLERDWAFGPESFADETLCSTSGLEGIMLGGDHVYHGMVDWAIHIHVGDFEIQWSIK